MRYSSTTAMMLAALSIGEAVAGPTHAHAHLHRRVHEKKDVDWAALDWDSMGINWSSAYEAGQTSKTAAAAVVAAPAATAVAPAVAPAVVAGTTAAPAAAAVSTATSSAPASSEVETLWNGLVGCANDVVEFGSITTGSGSEVAAIGNIGLPQGSNMMKVSTRSGQQYTNEFINTSGGGMTVVVWNKAYSTTGDAADAVPNLGFAVAPKTPILTFYLAPGASQIVAFAENTQIGFAEATGDIDISGGFATTWGECNFVSSGSGYDMSAIMNKAGNTYDMALSSVETPCISDMTQNYWYTSNGTPVPVGTSDGSCYIPGSTVTLTTKMGGCV